MSVFFSVSWGMNRSTGQTNRVNREAVLGRFVLFRATIHSPWTQKKDTHSLYLQCFQQRTLSKILREKIINSKFPQKRALNFVWCINQCAVIRSNCRTFCWLCSSGNELKNFSRVQRRKYVTIVNILYCFQLFYNQMNSSYTLTTVSYTNSTTQQTWCPTEKYRTHAQWLAVNSSKLFQRKCKMQ